MGVLQQASSISANSDSNYEMVEYVISLREGIMDAYDGIIIALKSSEKSKSLPMLVSGIPAGTDSVFSTSSRTLCSAYLWILVGGKRRPEQD